MRGLTTCGARSLFHFRLWLMLERRIWPLRTLKLIVDYLVTFGGCSDCHTPGTIGHPDMARFLGGSNVGFALPDGVFVGRNLTPNWSRQLVGRTNHHGVHCGQAARRTFACSNHAMASVVAIDPVRRTSDRCLSQKYSASRKQGARTFWP
jgi:hypothetical protein